LLHCCLRPAQLLIPALLQLHLTLVIVLLLFAFYLQHLLRLVQLRPDQLQIPLPPALSLW
jgi:cation transporter-like permease